ncbi:triple gene block protein 3 [Elderberry carlavirus B]|uniref:triple gene block protein 3 n=1 Tax=Elderberry carlavirus B TaxID=1569053 RepID=UPI00054A838B|nr:triple gene block protein 3 [Elderberry carlavirus B]AIZ76622.1 triple gene block protein 3 [Elderberry carlavirus B]
MWTLPNEGLIAILIVTLICLIFSALNYITTDKGASCTVVISGESIVIRGCEFTEQFIEYAKGLRVANHKLTP